MVSSEIWDFRGAERAVLGVSEKQFLIGYFQECFMKTPHATLCRLSTLCVGVLLWPVDLSAQVATGSGSVTQKQSSAQAAGEPTAPIIQFQFQNTYAPSVYEGEGHANTLVFEPVIPLPKNRLIHYPQLMRLTVPVFVTTPRPNRKRGYGDLVVSDELIVMRSAAMSLGVGGIVVLPTASDDLLGQGKYQLGPSVSVMSQPNEHWQIGILMQDQISVAGDSDRDNVHQLSLQPILNYIYGKYYLGVGDFEFTFDWEDGASATIPLAVQLGYVTRLGKYDYNFSIEPFKTVSHSGSAADWGVRLGFVMMIPE
jgi:hypothetical protein